MLRSVMATAALLSIGAAAPAAAQEQTCADSANLHQILTGIYQEFPVYTLIGMEGTDVHTLYVNPETQTWTLLRKTANEELTCVVRVGESFIHE